MKLNQLGEVVVVAEQGGIRAAARVLQIGQPSLTRSLAGLERELGITLFERRARGVVVTSLGQVFVDRARAILGDVRRIRDELGQLGGGSFGTVTAGLSIAAHLALLPGAIGPFLRRYPDTKLHVIEGFYPTLEAGLRNGTVDFYMGVDPGQKVAPELTRELFSPNRRTVLCRIGHPLAQARSLAELTGASWMSTSITMADEDEVGAVFIRHGLPAPKVCLRTQSALTTMTCLVSTDLLAMAPTQWTGASVVQHTLATITVREELAALPMVIIRRSDAVLTPAATHFLDLLRRGCILRAPKSPAARSHKPDVGSEAPVMQKAHRSTKRRI